MRIARFSRQSLAPRLLLGLTLALILLAATASSVFAAEHVATLPANGGTITFDGGDVTVKTPDGASDSAVSVTYNALASADYPGPAPEGTAIGSQVFSLDAGVTVFDQFAELTVSYTASDKDAADGSRDDNVFLYRWDANGGQWNQLYPTPNILDRTMTVYQKTLGTYAIIIKLPSVATVEATPTPTATPVMTETGDFGVTTSTMLALALLGALFLMGGGYAVARSRNR